MDKDNVSDKNVSGFYERDHREMDEKFNTYRELKREDFEEARDYFIVFYEELNRHIEWEEEILFPKLEEKVGEGFTETMKVEHDQIQEVLESLNETVHKGEPTSDAMDERLLKFLEPHNQSEEIVVYPAADKYLETEEIEELFSEMEH